MEWDIVLDLVFFGWIKLGSMHLLIAKLKNQAGQCSRVWMHPINTTIWYFHECQVFFLKGKKNHQAFSSWWFETSFIPKNGEMIQFDQCFWKCQGMCLKWKWLKWNISTNMCVCVCVWAVCFQGHNFQHKCGKGWNHQLMLDLCFELVVWIIPPSFFWDYIPAIIRVPLKPPVSEASTLWLRDSAGLGLCRHSTTRRRIFPKSEGNWPPEIQGMQVTCVFCLREGVSGLNRCTGFFCQVWKESSQQKEFGVSMKRWLYHEVLWLFF